MAEELDRDDRQAILGLQGGLVGFEYDLCLGEFADDDDWFPSSEKNTELPLPIPENEWDDTVVTGASDATPQFNGPYSKFKPHSKTTAVPTAASGALSAMASGACSGACSGADSPSLWGQSRGFW